MTLSVLWLHSRLLTKSMFRIEIDLIQPSQLEHVHTRIYFQLILLQLVFRWIGAKSLSS